MMSYWVIFIGFMLISWVVQHTMQSRFAKYSKEFLPSGLTGKEVAEKMLHENGIYDVQVTCIPGKLTDHYNPTNKTLNLSKEVYNGSSVASAAVAAHECGHAVQHAEAYYWLNLRSTLVPVVNIGGTLSTWILLGGLVLMGFTAVLGKYVAIAGICLYALTTLFAFITLPVEYNASNRALAWLENSNIAVGINHDHAKDALKWAARTYVVAAIASLATLLYYVSLVNRD
ncbi:MAG: zinc metallopeptidase [Bacteroidales bacterium]|nr:zinc metallopeptidase [Bacteroidales bacterium]MBR0055647.1 zinc metallopeptidase [Bacteroidales bacterium]